jgi:hypothetical protein
MRGETQCNLEDAGLGKLSVHDIDAGTAERIRTLAHTILAGQRERAARRSGFEQAYSRFLEPAWVSGVVVCYLIWAVKRALLFYQILR